MGGHKSAALCHQWRAVAAVVAVAEELNHDPAGPTRLCDPHCPHHHHSLGHSLGRCSSSGTRPRRRSRRGGGRRCPSRRSHHCPSNCQKDVRHHHQCRQCCRRRRCESWCNPVELHFATSRRRGCGDSSRHHLCLCCRLRRRLHRRLRHHCLGWYCCRFCRCCDGPR